MIKHCFSFVAFVCGVTLAGLAAIHFIWLHPAVLGPFALMIGMTPLVVLFAFSLEISAYWFLFGAVLAGVSWLVLVRNPPRPMAAKFVLLGGGLLVVIALFVFILASARYDVDMDGIARTGWSALVRPASVIGEVGLLLLASGLLIKATPIIHKNRSQNQSSMSSAVCSIGPPPDFLTSRTGRRTDGMDPTRGHAP